MPTTVNTHEAKTQLSRLLALVERGEEVVIARDGRPIAVLSRCKPQDGSTLLGALKGQIWTSDDFGEPLSPEEADGWYRDIAMNAPADR